MLARLFVARVLDNDLLSPTHDRAESFFMILGALAAPSVCLPLLFMPKYVFKAGAWVHAALLSDRMWLVALPLAVVAVATTLQWQALLPDLRDCLILGPLPVRKRTLAAAKAFAAGVFLLAVAGATSAFPTFLFPWLATRETSFVVLGERIVAMGVANALAALFAFASVIAAHSLVVLTLPWRLVRRAGPILQLGVLVGALMLLVDVTRTTPSFFAPDLAGLERHLGQPALWFLALQQHMLGDQTALFHELARTGLVAVGVAVSAMLLLYPLAARRLLGHFVDAPDLAPATPSWPRRVLVAMAHRLWLRRPGERAMFHFTVATLLRSQRHRLILAAVFAVGVVVVVTAVPSLAALNPDAGPFGVRGGQLAIALAVVMILIIGVRYALAVPTELPANWVFQLAAGSQIGDLMAGARKAALAVVAVALCPLFALHAVLWDVGPALAHVTFVLGFAALAIDAGTARLNKVPFTCSYVPGRANLRLLWLPYLLGFAYVLVLAVVIERWALAAPSHAVLVAEFFVLLHWGLTRLARWRQSSRTLVFEEHPEAALQGLILG
jgi:hypothetical protein